MAETLCMHAEIKLWPKSELLLEVTRQPILCPVQWEKVQTSLSQWEGLIGSLAQIIQGDSNLVDHISQLQEYLYCVLVNSQLRLLHV